MVKVPHPNENQDAWSIRQTPPPPPFVYFFIVAYPGMMAWDWVGGTEHFICSVRSSLHQHAFTEALRHLEGTDQPRS